MKFCLVRHKLYISIYLSFVRFILISYFFFHFIEHFITIFCNHSAIFSVPVRSLHFIVWPTVISSIAINVPQNTIVRLSCIITVIKSQYMCTLMFLRNFRMFRIEYISFRMCPVDCKQVLSWIEFFVFSSKFSM